MSINKFFWQKIKITFLDLLQYFCSQIPTNPKGSNYDSDGPEVDNDETQMLDLSLQD